MTQHFSVPPEAQELATSGVNIMVDDLSSDDDDQSRPDLQRQTWDELPQLKLNARRLARNRIVAAARTDPTYIAIDILRTKLMGMIREHGWKSLAITSPRGGCGKTTLALNLAFSLSQQPKFKTGLVDLDLRRPNIARLLHCQQAGGLEDFLRGRTKLGQSVFRIGCNLVVAPNAVPVSGPAELLAECITGPSIVAMRETLGLDLILYDLPPMLAADDALVVLPSVDAMLLVAAAGESTISEIESCERDLSQTGKLAGIVLNKCGYLPDRYGY